MRHSSWTLFLVPLALPLVLLLPGAMKSPGPADPVATATYEQIQTETALQFEDLSRTAASSDDSAREVSEALYKD